MEWKERFWQCSWHSLGRTQYNNLRSKLVKGWLALHKIFTNLESTAYEYECNHTLLNVYKRNYVHIHGISAGKASSLLRSTLLWRIIALVSRNYLLCSSWKGFHPTHSKWIFLERNHKPFFCMVENASPGKVERKLLDEMDKMDSFSHAVAFLIFPPKWNTIGFKFHPIGLTPKRLAPIGLRP